MITLKITIKYVDDKISVQHSFDEEKPLERESQLAALYANEINKMTDEIFKALENPKAAMKEIMSEHNNRKN